MRFLPHDALSFSPPPLTVYIVPGREVRDEDHRCRFGTYILPTYLLMMLLSYVQAQLYVETAEFGIEAAALWGS